MKLLIAKGHEVDMVMCDRCEWYGADPSVLGLVRCVVILYGLAWTPPSVQYINGEAHE